MMAAAFGPDVGSWLSASGVVGFFILLLLLSIFLSPLCSGCSRRSFELRDSEVDKDPSTLIKVAKLEDGLVERENPRINEDLKDDIDINSSIAPHSIYQTIGGEGSNLTNHQPGAESSVSADVNSVYAQVSKKERATVFPDRSPEEVLEKVSSPPLPDRKAQLE
uniref:uncharacterized protein si:ch73-204p21.2 isoform X2 n=1 Tax=Gasterosteus aculeatus aculeatus TaxID=481459 RepID=UPI001A98E647|nr:uncharacterized protein si:ch73-204p21.2 isoform X2 [Gasterosteus aculeatus aculeatus]